MDNTKGKNATTKNAGRQWNDDEGVDLRFRLVENLHSLVADEAEALAGYAKLLESDNPYLDDKDKAAIKAIMANERDHENKLNDMITMLDAIVADSNVDEIAGADSKPKGDKKDAKKGKSEPEEADLFIVGMEA